MTEFGKHNPEQHFPAEGTSKPIAGKQSFACPTVVERSKWRHVGSSMRPQRALPYAVAGSHQTSSVQGLQSSQALNSSDPVQSLSHCSVGSGPYGWIQSSKSGVVSTHAEAAPRMASNDTAARIYRGLQGAVVRSGLKFRERTISAPCTRWCRWCACCPAKSSQDSPDFANTQYRLLISRFYRNASSGMPPFHRPAVRRVTTTSRGTFATKRATMGQESAL